MLPLHPHRCPGWISCTCVLPEHPTALVLPLGCGVGLEGDGRLTLGAEACRVEGVAGRVEPGLGLLARLRRMTEKVGGS